MMTTAPTTRKELRNSTIAQVVAIGAAVAILAPKSCGRTPTPPRPIACQLPHTETVILQPTCGNAKLELEPEYRGRQIPQARTSPEGVYWNTNANSIVTPAANGALPEGTIHVVARGYPETVATCYVDATYGPRAPEHPCADIDAWLPNLPVSEGLPPPVPPAPGMWYYKIHINENVRTVPQPTNPELGPASPTREVENIWYRGGAPAGVSGQTNSICPVPAPTRPGRVRRAQPAPDAGEEEEPEPAPPAPQDRDCTSVALRCDAISNGLRGGLRRFVEAHNTSLRDGVARTMHTSTSSLGGVTLNARYDIDGEGNVTFRSMRVDGRGTENAGYSPRNVQACELRSCHFDLDAELSAPPSE